MEGGNSSGTCPAVDINFVTSKQPVPCDTQFTCERSLFLQIYLSLVVSAMIVSTILNSVIIITIYSNRRLHTVPNVFITSLAVSDITSSCVFGVSEFVILSEKTLCHLPATLKRARSFILALSISSNVGCHIAISVERWLYIARPFLHQRIVTRRSTTCVLLLVWSVSVAISVNRLVSNIVARDSGRDFTSGIIRPIVHFVLCSLMMYIYLHIAHLTRRALLSISKTRPVGVTDAVQAGNGPQTSIKATWRNIRMLVIVFGTFFIFVTPGVCADIYSYSKASQMYFTVGGKIVDILWSTHCCLNFFIYAAQDRVFRDLLKKGLSKLRHWVVQGCFSRVHAVTDSSREQNSTVDT